MVYLEAQLMGLPVAAMRSMGVPLVVDHGKTGFLSEECQPGGPVDEYRRILAMLVSHPDLRKDLGKAARGHVQDKHSLEAGARALKMAMDHILQ